MPTQDESVQHDSAPPKKPRRRFKKAIRRFLMFMAKYTLPYLYLAYMRFVWQTSKFFGRVDEEVSIFEQTYKKYIVALWHQDVFWVPWAYKKFHPVTLASVGDAGEIITKLLKMCQYKAIFRGGSSRGKARHKEVLPEMIEYIRNLPKGCVGITVDGSNGPCYHLKRGIIVMAKECNIPLFVIRIWCKKKILLPTWDKTVIPLPFNQIGFFRRGPFFVPENADDPEVFEKFRSFVERQLMEATEEGYRKFGH